MCGLPLGVAADLPVGGLADDVEDDLSKLSGAELLHALIRMENLLQSQVRGCCDDRAEGC
eukprot:5406095-Prymnesium_polylepis.2